MSAHLTDAERESLTCDCGINADDPTWPEMFCPFHADRMNLEVGGSADALVATVERILDARLAALPEQIAVRLEAVSRRLAETAFELSRDPHELRGAQEMFAAKCFSDAAKIARGDDR